MTGTEAWPQSWVGQQVSWVGMGGFLHGPPTSNGPAKEFLPVRGDPDSSWLCKMQMLSENSWDKSWQRRW